MSDTTPENPKSFVGAALEERLSKIWVKITSILLTILMGVGGHLYGTINTRISVLEDKVTHLQQDKVSRAEFKEEMTQLRAENTNNMQNILTRLDANTSRTENQLRETVNMLKFALENRK